MCNSSHTETAAAAGSNEHCAAAAPAHGETHATTEAHGGGHEVAPAVFGMDATAWVSLAMVLLLGILIYKKVPAMIGKILDGRIDAIKAQLEEASKLRAEAEALKAEYDKKLKGAAKDAKALRVRAEDEAKQMLEDAKAQADDLVKRRKKMAEEKIGAAERAAVADIRAKAVQAATAAASALITQNHAAAQDKGLVDSAISALGTVN